MPLRDHRDADDAFTTAYIGVGANIDPEPNIEGALQSLMKRVDVTRVSSFYRSEPVGHLMSPPFVNGVFEIATDIAPVPLKLDVLRGVEKALGRKRTDDKFAPREIDLDLIEYGGRMIASPVLTIPDPDIYRHSYVAVPLAELAPELILPDTGMVVSAVDSANKTDELLLLESFTAELKRWLS